MMRTDTPIVYGIPTGPTSQMGIYAGWVPSYIHCASTIVQAGAPTSAYPCMPNCGNDFAAASIDNFYRLCSKYGVNPT